MATPLVSALGLRKVFEQAGQQVVALDGVDLEAFRGEIVAVTGSSGSGKTTLLNLLSGLLRPTAGRVALDGEDLGALDEGALARLRLARVGLVFQEACLVASLSAADNVRLPLLLSGRTQRSLDRARELLEAVGLAERERFLPRQLSRGEAQRVAIARALACDPALVLADEPTGSLDEAASRQVAELLERVARGAHRAVVVATHDRVLAGAADRTIHLRYGRLAAG